MKTLVFLGRARVAQARKRLAAGASLLAWSEETAALLEAASIPAKRVADVLSQDDADQIDDAAIAWTRAWGKRPHYDGQSFRELSAWKGVSLWWFAELYLFHSTGAAGRVRSIETFLRILEAEVPEEVEAVGLRREEAVLLGRACLARGVLFHGPRRVSALQLARRERAQSLRARWITAKTTVTALKSWLAGKPRQPPANDSRLVLFLSHAAFWRKRTEPATGRLHDYEHYFDRLIPEVGQHPKLQPFVVAVGPGKSFRRRRKRDRLGEWLRLRPESPRFVHMDRYSGRRVLRSFLRATREARTLWRRLRRSPGAHEAFSHAGVAFADLAEPDLAGTLLLQLPWAVRCYEEMASVLEALRPAVVCLYAEGSGWGRAAEAACQAAGVPTVAIQHGIIYPRYFSYQHEADDLGCPRPDRTAVFGEAARHYLIEEGHYPPESLIVTGSPKFDALLEAARSWDREDLRRGLGVAVEERLLVVASRYRGIRSTHQAIGTAFSGLVRAAEEIPNLRVLVKPHPAEPADAYREVLSELGAERTRVLRPSADLMELLYAADGLVTVESLSAVEALVLGRPVLILNMPTNLRQMVERGVALGVPRGVPPGDAIRRLLFDPATRSRLQAAREHYLPEVAFGLDGGATRRMLELIQETANAGTMVG